MNQKEIALRKKAIQLYLSGEPKTKIARQIGRSRAWVYRWTKRYNPDHLESSLADQERRPKRPYQSWSEEIHQMVTSSRKLRLEARQPGYEYALISAEAIHYELRELGVSPTPPVRTIHYWLKQAGLILEKPIAAAEKRPPKPYPAPASAAINDLHQLDLKGPFYLFGDAQKHYLCVLQDVCSKRVALAVIVDKQMETIMDCLLSAWQKLGLPMVLQMDNGLEFRGSNRYPRSFGKLVWLCLDLGIEPLFIPPHEPWRNGVVENLNGLLERLFLGKETFQDLAHLQNCTQDLEQAINNTHHLPALEGKTPAEFAQSASVCQLPEGYQWRKRNLQLVKGKISFVRLVRKSGRITLCAQDKFEIGQEYQWQYVLATVDVAAHRLDIFCEGEHIKSFEYH